MLYLPFLGGVIYGFILLMNSNEIYAKLIEEKLKLNHDNGIAPFHFSNSIDAPAPQSFIKDALTEQVFHGLERNAI